MAATTEASTGAVTGAAAELIVQAMDAAGFPGADIAKMLSDRGPEVALMAGSAVLHSIIRAGGGLRDADTYWTPGDFDIFLAPAGRGGDALRAFMAEVHAAQPALRESPGLDTFYAWRLGPIADGAPIIVPLNIGQLCGGPALQLIEWPGIPQAVINGFDFPLLRVQCMHCNSTVARWWSRPRRPRRSRPAVRG